MPHPIHTTEEDWNRVERIKEKAGSYLSEPHLCNITIACLLVELRDRLNDLEHKVRRSKQVWVGTEADVAPQVVPIVTTAADGLSPVGPAPQAHQGVTNEELVNCLPIGVWHGPVGYNSPAFAQYLLDHPRLGPLLRGEGAPAPKRVVLPEEPPEADTPRCWRRIDGPYKHAWQEGYAAGWAAAYTEVERQQGGQADG